MSENLSSYDGQVHDPTGVYPLNWNSNLQNSTKLNLSNISNNDEKDHNIYPDFNVWHQTKDEENIMKNHLQKGYIEPQFVKHEDQSGRQLITELLNRSNINQSQSQSQSQSNQQQRHFKLDLMGQILVDAMHKRRIFNGIKSKGNYKPPPRVTLTEHKKETWLKKLANPNIPLQELSRAIPHGLKNKILLEQCLNHEIPISRAIWLIKSISTNEQRQLKRKTTNISTMNLNSNKWIIEWSEQITSFFEHIIESCFNSSLPKDVWRYRLNYTIELIVNLYSEELLSQITLLTWIVRYLSHIVKNATSFIDLKPLLIHQMVIKLFWFKIIRYDYLTKELSESMLLGLVKTNQLQRDSKFDSIAQKIAGVFQYLIKYLFYYNSDIFILPSNWNYLKPYLKKVLDLDLAPVSEQFKLIAYRNESLTIDEFDTSSNPNSQSIPNDKFLLILNKLNNTEKENIASLSKVIFEDNTTSDTTNWKCYIHLIFQWCIQAVRENNVIIERITLICSILQFRQSQLIQSKSKRFKQFKVDLENKIIDFVYSMSEVLNYQNKNNPKGDFYNINGFLFLINRLNTMKLFVVSSYLRRLIASGVIYLSDPDRTCYIHILILNFLPSLNDSNLKSILKRLTDSTKIQIVRQDMNLYKTLKSNFVNSILSEKDIDIEIFLNQYNNKEILSFTDPIQIGQHLQLGEYFYQQLDSKIKNSNVKFSLTTNKLVVLYESFLIHSNGLSKFLLLIINALNQDDPKIDIDNEETFVIFLKMLFINIKLLKYSLLNLKTSLWDQCLNILNTWIDSDKYNIIESLYNTNLPDAFLQLFGNRATIIKSFKVQCKFLSSEELISLDLASHDRLSNAAEFVHYATLAITRYSNCIRENDESVNIHLITKFLQNLQCWKNEEFNKCLSDYLIRYLKPTLQLDYESNVKLLLRLVIDRFINIKTIVDIFQNKNSNNYFFETNNDNIHLLWNIFFNSRYEFGLKDGFLYKYAQFCYIQENPRDYFKILTHIIYMVFHKTYEKKQIDNVLADVAHNVGVNNVDSGVGVGVGVDVNVDHSVGVGVDVMDTFHDLNTNQENNEFPLVQENLLNDKVIDSFWELVSSYSNLAVEYFYIPMEDFNHINFENLKKFVFNRLLNIYTEKEIDDIQIVENLNYFNLHILQWIFSFFIRGKYNDSIEFHENSNIFVGLIENILAIVEKYGISHKLVGELFNFLPDNYKHKMLFACEEIYLNSDNFPIVLVNGINATDPLNYILSSCSRLKMNQNGSLTQHNKLEMSDALVFSLNSALEKLINICHNLDHQHKKRLANRTSMSADLELGIKMVSKIILLHKYFLVELMLRRSVNLQRDVLLLNLMKLFNHKIMAKNLKLKNLLYDVLISIKAIISESIAIQFQKHQLLVSSNPNNFTNIMSPGVRINKGSTPTNGTFFSPMNSPKPIPLSFNGNSHTITATSPLAVNANDDSSEQKYRSTNLGNKNNDDSSKINNTNDLNVNGFRNKPKLSAISTRIGNPNVMNSSNLGRSHTTYVNNTINNVNPEINIDTITNANTDANGNTNANVANTNTNYHLNLNDDGDNNNTNNTASVINNNNTNSTINNSTDINTINNSTNNTNDSNNRNNITTSINNVATIKANTYNGDDNTTTTNTTTTIHNINNHKFNNNKNHNNTSNGNNNNNHSNTGTNTNNRGTPYIVMPNILNIKPPSFNNNLKNLLTMFDLKDTIKEKESRYYLVNQNWDGSIDTDETLTKYNIKPFELIENSCPRYAMDDCAIPLQMFGVSGKRENPP